MNNSTPKAKWYTELLHRFNELVQRTGLPEDVASEVKILLFEIAKEQYLAGNRSGIAWLRKQQAMKSEQSYSATPSY